MANDKTVTILLTEYKGLLEDSRTLRALEEAGVNNWEGYPCFDEDEEDEGDDA